MCGIALVAGSNEKPYESGIFLLVRLFMLLSSGNVSVKVSGDVLHPGIYEVPANTLAMTVIKMAVPIALVNAVSHRPCGSTTA